MRGLRLLVLACGIMWDWAFGYLGLAAEVEDFCNPVREHGTPGEHGPVSMYGCRARERIHANAAHLRVLHPAETTPAATSGVDGVLGG